MNPLIQLKTTILPVLITFVLGCFGLLPRAQAVSPPPAGGYPNFTTAAGDHALQALTLGLGNTAIGTFSMFSVTTGSFNTAVGAGSLDLNTADSNTATGAAALLFNTTGTLNTANGTAALEFNDTGSNNTATGAFALFNNTTGHDNTANGFFALQNNTTGNWNTANGAVALSSNVTGNENTAYGQVALQNATGSKNIGIGTGGGCKLTTGSNNIAIVNPGVAGESDTIRIGAIGTETNCAGFPLPAHTATYIAGISGQTASGGAVVFVNPDGKLGTLTSSARFKTDIKPMDKTSEAILSLKPVTFRYKKEIDPTGTSQFGLVAEDVEKVNSDLVVRDKGGKPYSVRYEQVNAMLLNEFLKEHRKVEQQRKDFEAAIAQQQKQIEALTAGLQKVSAQLEASKPAPQVVNNP